MEKNVQISDKRESNIELLRVFCILLIIMHHIVVHCIVIQLGDSKMYPAGEMFNNFVFYKRLIFFDFMACFGKMSNNIFILITGYFMCEKVDININKQLKKILGQVLFASVFLMIISALYNAFFDNTFTSTLPISIFNNEWYFIGYYVCIIVIARVFLNKYIQNLDQKRYSELLIILFAIVSIMFTKGLISNISPNLTIVLTGVFLYSLGGYIKKYDMFKKVNIITLIIVLILSFVIMGLSYRNYTMDNILSSLKQGKQEYFQSIRLYEENSLMSIVIAVCIFEIFRRIKIPKSNVINYIASATFMIYLMHDNDFVRTIYRSFDWIKPFHDDVFGFMKMYFIYVFSIYVFGFVSYLIYKLVKRALHKIID